MTLYIYGASDDLIEVEGSIIEEFNPPYNKPARLVISVDGATYASLRIEYDPDDTGEWRISSDTASAPVSISAARGEDEGEDEHGCPGYSDLATVRLDDIGDRRIEMRIEDAS